MNPRFIQLIADYGTGDPAFGEVIQKLTLLDPNVRVHPTSVPKFSTIATGFWTAQYGLVSPVPGMIIYTNTAPRKEKTLRNANTGEKLVVVELVNGIHIVGVNAGYCFSFVKPFIKNIHLVKVSNKGSQFRSRDYYPEAVIGIANGNRNYFDTMLDPKTIPDVPERRIAWIDGYGNLKTTLRASEIHYTPGQTLLVTLNGMHRTVFYADFTFAVREGEIAFAPGSSGGEDKYMELFMRGLSAWKEFGKPAIESAFSVETV